jgi:pimeloyl-ACP methyl ester carboxylesterase
MHSKGTGPSSQTYISQRLRLHYVDWGNEGAPPLLLIHGGRDHCRNWDWVAERLKDRFHIIAPDLRGHGDSAWALGSSYGLLEFVADIAQLVRQKQLAPVNIIAHSLGGNIALHYAGLYPDAVARLVAIEGLGPSPAMLEKRRAIPPERRIGQWVETLRDLSARTPRKYATIEDALKRMRDENPHLSEAQARHLTLHGVLQNEDGTYSWKFDNYVRAFSPVHLSAEESRALYGRITCPTLLMRGMESWASDPEADGRAKAFSNARVINVPNAGHWVHHDQLEVFMGHVDAFFAAPDGATA